MAFTLYSAFIPRARQALSGLHSVIGKGEAYAKDKGLDPAELIEARLAEDMWTLPWHVRACWVHSGYAIDQIKAGEFTPDFTSIPDDWDSMRAMVDDALAQLEKVSPDDLEAVSEATIGFILGGKRIMELKGSDFLLSFNQPNLYFHATTFYDILRMKGVPLSKMDFMGPVPALGR